MTAFYLERSFQSVWISEQGIPTERLAYLHEAMSNADSHGLDPIAVGLGKLEAIELNGGPAMLAEAEATVSQLYLDFAQIIHSGIVEPSTTSEFIHLRKRRRIPARYLMEGIAGDHPVNFLENLAPQIREYAELRKELLRLRGVRQAGGWGAPVPKLNYTIGMQGPAVVTLRDRLVRKGYLDRQHTNTYSLKVANAVRQFQLDYGLKGTGIVNWRTIEALNVSVDDQILQLEVGLERLRWLNQSLGARYMIVNIPEYRARLVDRGKTIFESNVVVGQAEETHQTPEFSDEMEHLVVNPIWYVPRSIVDNEIIPALIEDPAAEPDLLFIDTERMALIDRRRINFDTPSVAEEFQYTVVQPPGRSNPLGSVKFMFPNQHSIYLHDSPYRDLFELENRAHSHGCVRVQKSHELASMLLGEIGLDFDTLISGVEGTFSEELVVLQTRFPVHITYRTVWSGADGRIHYRRDIYDRDKPVHDALSGYNQAS